MSKSELVVAFITSSNPRDERSWSGAYRKMLESLEKEFVKVVPLGPIDISKSLEIILRIVSLSHKLFFNKRFNKSHSILKSIYYGSKFKKRLKQEKFDLIFAPAASTEIACLNTKTPIIYYSDTSFNQIRDYYSDYSNLSGFSIRVSNFIQQRAINKSSIIIHSSEWASKYAIDYYKIDKKHAYVLPFGANIDKAPKIDILNYKLRNKSTCNLLFLGADWDRKGGIIAYETFIELNKLNLDTTLTLCGSIPPEEYNHHKLRIVPYLDKNNEKEYMKYLELLDQAHFLIQPTRAECFGCVYCEASAYGIPSITTDTGGVGDAIENGINGFRLPKEAKGTDYAKLIYTIFNDEAQYRDLVYSSRKKYDDELTWEIFAHEIKKIAMQLPKKS